MHGASKLLWFGILFGWMVTVRCALPKVNSSALPVDHSDLSSILQKHVDADGCVNYLSLQSDSSTLNQYLAKLQQHHPNATWSENERKAYWINAYNAFTLQLIVRNFPVSSIKDLGGSIYKVNTAWDIRFITIESATYDLNNIEHDILRKEFNDPRIHFAINCASESCPVLLNEAYVADQLDAQLDSAAVRFINDPKRNAIGAASAEISRIFLWFRGDFTESQSIQEFISMYSRIPLTKSTKISHLPYDWSLNACP
jgi:hypothetical protein